VQKKEVNMILDFRNNTNLQQKSPVFLMMGILLLVLGILAIAYAKWATVFTIELLGVFLILGGIVHLVNAFQGRGWKGISLSTLLGVLYFVMGVICIYKPLEAASGITLLLGAFFFIGGLYRMISSITARFQFAGLWFLNGLIAFILGILIITEWPIGSLWIIGVFVGIDMILNGLSWIGISLALKKK
jgi:uncharacterized membrane protein HdeD (DUF308 family)